MLRLVDELDVLELVRSLLDVLELVRLLLVVVKLVAKSLTEITFGLGVLSLLSCADRSVDLGS